MTDEHVNGMLAAADLADRATRTALADTLREAGRTKEADLLAREEEVSFFAGQVRLARQTGLSQEKRQALRAALQEANGRRRLRTISWKDCLACAEEAFLSEEGWSVVSGGCVGKNDACIAYHRTPYQTACLAARKSNGRLRVVIGRVEAYFGASAVSRLSGLTRASRPARFRDWADAEGARAGKVRRG